MGEIVIEVKGHGGKVKARRGYRRTPGGLEEIDPATKGWKRREFPPGSKRNGGGSTGEEGAREGDILTSGLGEQQ